MCSCLKTNFPNQCQRTAWQPLGMRLLDSSTQEDVQDGKPFSHSDVQHRGMQYSCFVLLADAGSRLLGTWVPVDHRRVQTRIEVPRLRVVARSSGRWWLKPRHFGGKTVCDDQHESAHASCIPAIHHPPGQGAGFVPSGCECGKLEHHDQLCPAAWPTLSLLSPQASARATLAIHQTAELLTRRSFLATWILRLEADAHGTPLKVRMLGLGPPHKGCKLVKIWTPNSVTHQCYSTITAATMTGSKVTQEYPGRVAEPVETCHSCGPGRGSAFGSEQPSAEVQHAATHACESMSPPAPSSLADHGETPPLPPGCWWRTIPIARLPSN
ncbi:hypothetical protein LIA77_01127 [Sarocladium implicatum]|nr:hypothetical protein LIA77_01127 [Sarocladium implicatum]